MKDYTTDSPEFSKSIGSFETTDPAHADLFNGDYDSNFPEYIGPEKCTGAGYGRAGILQSIS